MFYSLSSQIPPIVQQQHAAIIPAAIGAAASASTTSGGWSQHFSPDGRIYYYNERTKESSWDKPDELMSKSERLLAQCPWKEYKTDTGKVYYHNVITKESEWTMPPELQQLKAKVQQETESAASKSISPAQKSSTDAATTDASAADTSVSNIQLPSLSEEQEGQTAASAAATAAAESDERTSSSLDNAISAAVAATGGALLPSPDSNSNSRSGEESRDKAILPPSSVDTSTATGATTGSANNTEVTNSPMSSSSSSAQPSATNSVSTVSTVAASAAVASPKPDPPKDLNTIFRELMRDKNVPSNVSWETAIKSISSDARYELFRHHPERRQMFNAYKTQKVKEEREEQRLKARLARENLEKHLQSSRLMNSTIRYRQACEIFRDNEHWKAVPETDRREIFDDAIKLIAEREREEAKVLRKRNMRVLSDILDSMPMITHRVSWQEAQQLLLDNPVFADDKALLGMDKEDALVIFEGHIRQLEAEEEEERKRERKRVARQQRKNRENFIQLLDELHAQGKLTSISKWTQLYQEICSDSRFAVMLSPPCVGSTPLDLFKFYVEELKARYEDEKVLIKQMLKERQFQITAQTTYEQFATVVSEDQRSEKLDAGNVRMVYERLVDRAREAERDRMREVNKQRRKLEMQFIGLLTRLQPPVSETTRWEDIRDEICEDDAFKCFETETERIQIFAVFQKSLEESCSHHHGKARKQKKQKKQSTKRRRHSSSSAASEVQSMSDAELQPMEVDDALNDAPASSAPKHLSSHHQQQQQQQPDDQPDRPASPTEHVDEDGENQDDLEELERQRQILLQQLAAHR